MEKDAWCENPYKNYCAKIENLYRGDSTDEGAPAFEVIEVYRQSGVEVTISSFNPGKDLLNCPLGDDDTIREPKRCKPSADKIRVPLEYLPVQCDPQNPWNETQKSFPKGTLAPPSYREPVEEPLPGEIRVDCEGGWTCDSAACDSATGDPPSWSTCEDGQRTQTYKITKPLEHGGEVCVWPNNKVGREECGTECVGSFDPAGWSTCLNNTQELFYTISQEARGGGKDCVHKAEEHGYKKGSPATAQDRATRECGMGQGVADTEKTPSESTHFSKQFFFLSY